MKRVMRLERTQADIDARMRSWGVEFVAVGFRNEMEKGGSSAKGKMVSELGKVDAC